MSLVIASLIGRHVENSRRSIRLTTKEALIKEEGIVFQSQDLRNNPKSQN